MLICHSKNDDQYLDLGKIDSVLQDVAIKVYVGSKYSENTLQDYKKEVHLKLVTFNYIKNMLVSDYFWLSLAAIKIEIMKRLRHPNVLLFMGAVYSKERPAIVTELMPR